MIRQRYRKVDDPSAGVTDVIDSDVANNKKGLTAAAMDVRNDFNNRTTQTVEFVDDSSYRLQKLYHYNFLYYIFHIISVVIGLFGVLFTFQKLYTHEECDMTWSQRQFIQVSIIQQDKNQQRQQSIINDYKFYKFIDRRDPRYTTLHQRSIVYGNESDTWCSNTGNSQHRDVDIVLYVPGHGGSYEQSRSIGAHGIQLTHQSISYHMQQQILQKLMTKSPQNESMISSLSYDDYFYDVYAFDFNEEGGAFHGLLLERQSQYIADTIMAFTNACRSKDTRIHIVAHSMGGISTRYALMKYPNLRQYVSNVITLGTPHSIPIWNWQPSIHNLYHQLWMNFFQTKNNNSRSLPNIVSISGGFRDEMIPPISCFIPDTDSRTITTLSIHATDIMLSPTTISIHKNDLMGMDHRAIVWCHNLLLQVRFTLYQLSTTSVYNQMVHDDLDAMNANEMTNTIPLQYLSRTLSLNTTYNYIQSIDNLKQAMKKKYGTFTAFLMETSLLYNTEILVNLFAVIGTMHYVVAPLLSVAASTTSTTLMVLLPSITSGLLYHIASSTMIGQQQLFKYNIPIQSLLVLAFIADALFIITQYILHRYVKGIWWKYCQKHSTIQWLVVRSILLLVCIWIPINSIYRNELWFRMELIISTTAIALVYLLALFLIVILPSEQNNKVQNRTSRRVLPNLDFTYNDRSIEYVTWIILLIPFLVAGDFYAIVKGVKSWEYIKLLSPIVIRLVIATSNNSSGSVSFSSHKATRNGPIVVTIQFCRIIAATLCCWRLLTRDIRYQVYTHPLSTLIIAVSMCDVLLEGAIQIS